MKLPSWHIVRTAAVAPLWIAGFVSLTGCGVTKEFHQTYSLAPNGKIFLENATGGANIVGWDRDEIEVSVIARAQTGERLQEAEIEVDAAPDTIRLRTVYPGPVERWGNSIFRPSGPASVEYRLRVPRRATLEQVDVVNSNLRITDVEGTIRARVQDGHARASFTRLSDTSTSVTLETVNGDIHIRFPAGPDVRLEARSRGGWITTDIGIPVRSANPAGNVVSNLSEILGAGRVRIRLNATEGDISITESPGL